MTDRNTRFSVRHMKVIIGIRTGRYKQALSEKHLRASGLTSSGTRSHTSNGTSDRSPGCSIKTNLGDNLKGVQVGLSEIAIEFISIPKPDAIKRLERFQVR